MAFSRENNLEAKMLYNKCSKISTVLDFKEVVADLNQLYNKM